MPCSPQLSVCSHEMLGAAAATLGPRIPKRDLEGKLRTRMQKGDSSRVLRDVLKPSKELTLTPSPLCPDFPLSKMRRKIPTFIVGRSVDTGSILTDTMTATLVL